MYDENDPTQQPGASGPVPFAADGRRQPGQGGIDMGAILAVDNTIQGSETSSGNLELAELNRQFPIDKLCGPASMQS